MSRELWNRKSEIDVDNDFAFDIALSTMNNYEDLEIMHENKC